MVPAFFEDVLYRRSPTGNFGVTRRKRNMPDVTKGTLLIFSYSGRCMYVAESAGPVVQCKKDRKDFDPAWPAYLHINMATLEPANIPLQDLQRVVNRAAGTRRDLVHDRNWPRIEDKYRRAVERLFLIVKTECSALEDSEAPPGNNRPDRALSTRYTYARDEKVRQYILGRAKGRCELCRKLGFPLPGGGHYLESHHIIALAKDGADQPSNVIALCAHHHREAHFGVNAVALEAKMIRIARNREAKTQR